VILGLLPGLTTQYGLLVAFEIVQLAALAQAWNLMAGYGGVVSLAVAAFVGVGSYGTAKLSEAAGLGVLPSVLAGGVFAVLFALAVSVPMFRFRGLYFTIGSLVLAQALAIFLSNYNGLGGNQGITLNGTAPSQDEIWYLSAALAVAATLAVAWLVRSRLGLGLKSIRDDEDVAERVGVVTFRTKLAAFTVAAFVMGIVGGIQAQRTGYVEPSGAFALNWTIETVNAAIIGGVGTIAGPLIGSAISVELSQALASYPEVHLTILGVLLIAIIRLAPDGLWGLARQLAKRGYGRLTQRGSGRLTAGWLDWLAVLPITAAGPPEGSPASVAVGPLVGPGGSRGAGPLSSGGSPGGRPPGPSTVPPGQHRAPCCGGW
jgi:branched-chain amino acid transport system permease protein